MLLIDVSNVMYTGAGFNGNNFGRTNIHPLKSIPYFLKTVASLHMYTGKMVAVFEKTGRMPALSNGNGYKSGRAKNSKVEWEIKALRKILEKANFPILEVEGQESDYIIYNYCRQHRHNEDIYIASVDMDMTSQVCKHDTGSVQIVSFSSLSYNIDKNNFKEITGVDYNFMDLNKILLGCKSDKIKRFPNGTEIYEDYISTVKSQLRRTYGFDINSPLSTVPDSIIFEMNSYNRFEDWYMNSSFYTSEGLKDLRARQKLVMGPEFLLPQVPPVNWFEYNRVAKVFNSGVVEMEEVPKFSLEEYDEMEKLLDSVSSEYSIFEAAEQIEVIPETPQLQNLLGVLEKGGF